MMLLLDEPTIDTIFPELYESSEGPQYLDVMLIGYCMAEDSEDGGMYLAINRDGKFNEFNNSVYVLKIFSAPKGHKKYVKKSCGANVEYIVLEKELEGARVVCEENKRKKERSSLDLKKDLVLEEDLQKQYVGKIYPANKDYSYCTMFGLDRELPMRRVRKDTIDKLVANETSKLKDFEQRVKEGQLNYKTYRELTAVRFRIQDKISKKLLQYFEKLFSEDLDGWTAVESLNSGFVMEVLPIQFLFYAGGFVSRYADTTPNEKLYWCGSIQDFKKVTFQKLKSDESEGKKSPLNNAEKYFQMSIDLGICRDNYWKFIPEICAGLSAIPAAGLSYWADWDYAWIVPGFLVADQLTRKVISKFTNRPGAPGIIGLGKTVVDYVRGFFKREENVA